MELIFTLFFLCLLFSIVLHSLILIYKRCLYLVPELDIKLFILQVFAVYILIALSIATYFLNKQTGVIFLGLANSAWVTFLLVFIFLSFKKDKE